MLFLKFSRKNGSEYFWAIIWNLTDITDLEDIGGEFDTLEIYSNNSAYDISVIMMISGV